MTSTGVARHDGQTETIRPRHNRGDLRLEEIADALAEVVVDDRPDYAVIENVFAGARGGVGPLLGMVQGVVRLTLRRTNVPYFVVEASTLKKYATGSGSASKADMRVELLKRTGVDLAQEDEVDAWWLRALGLDVLGAPVLELPRSHREALRKGLSWPEWGAPADQGGPVT